ncbi:50S ribosomal protein L6 [Candidatus Collierbacteria bacterium CG10_big_fil_rev_8_21_14_0_10_44_9]|uniref:Large ribosomal subunit protein uL6 n=1 Tax=Candidatus Collierbacteria bacterium CG10_big_fil_rev_8_21_14_0_10_44_9 TaxID=1974535 RepID=A0A2H0VJN4_9BACT|nr:MAG: 50S ribosomal protein L6 [Candidatus Collierbacteria bacterium CG10_big_fil_rev_8_21_14_0_10_44_9]
MSKIGRLPITIPPTVNLTINGNLVNVKGSKGELSYTLTPKIKLELTGDQLVVSRTSEDKPVRALHGLTRALIANMVKGVSDGFSKNLELVGTGYRARLTGTKLILSLGYSHEIEFVPPKGIEIKVEGTNVIIVSGFDIQAVGQVSSVIRSYRKPEPYKGKGIRYAGEVVRRKAGKATKATTA